jgi:hypothetical protein
MPYALALGIVITDTPNKPPKTMTEIFTSKGKGARKEKPIGFQSEKPNRDSGPPDAQTLGLCRESITSTHQNAPPPAPAPQDIESASLEVGQVKAGHCEATEADKQAAGNDQIVRIRDSDLMADSYDLDTGEFYRPPLARPSARAKANCWVREGLRAVRGQR